MAEWIIVILLVLILITNRYGTPLRRVMSQLDRIERHLAERIGNSFAPVSAMLTVPASFESVSGVSCHNRSC